MNRNHLVLVSMLICILVFSGIASAVPGIPSITFGQSEYYQGDTIEVTLIAEDDGRYVIEKFWIQARYTNTVDDLYEGYVTAKYLGNDQYSAEISFTASTANKVIEVNAHAIDTNGNAGSRGEATVYTNDPPASYTMDSTQDDNTQIQPNYSAIFFFGLITIIALLLVLIVVVIKKK